MNIYSFSHQGNKKTQEDAILIIPQQNMFAVCDGVGSSSQGALASQFIIDFIKINSESFGNNIEKLIIDASKGLEQLSINEGILTEMATTIVIVKIIGGSIVTTHLGDSKFMYFCFEEPAKNFISQDHSFMEELKSAGVIHQDEFNFPYKNMITKYISNHRIPELADISTTTISDVNSGDIILLCSDGALENISPTELGKLFSGNLEKIDENWLYFSNLCKNESKDNASCVMVRF